MSAWKNALQRRDDVRAAFVEGLMIGTNMVAPGEPLDDAEKWRRSEAGIETAWKASAARKALERPLEEARFDPALSRHQPAERRDPHVHQVGEAAARVLSEATEEA